MTMTVTALIEVSVSGGEDGAGCRIGAGNGSGEADQHPFAVLVKPAPNLSDGDEL